MTLFRLVFLGLLAAMLLPEGGMAQVRPSSSNLTEGAPALISQLRNQLRAPEARQRELALVDVIALANCKASCTLGLHSLQNSKLRIDDETGAVSVLDLNELVPDVRRVYRRDPVESHKLLALSALINIGNEEALDSLIEKPSNSAASNVGRQTNLSIAAFFLEKYPELKSSTERTGHLSLTDVQRVRAVHLKRVQHAEGN